MEARVHMERGVDRPETRTDRPPRGEREVLISIFGEFDSGSERTLAAWMRHASRTVAGG